ncbi:MAG: type II toxin-antitoxin system PemK/MazF family toxin [Methanobacteriota archaeon]
MRLDAGDLVLVPFPHTDLTAGKQRPALVLTSASYNAASPDAVIAYVTSLRQEGPWSVPVTSADLSTGALAKQSWVRVDRLATLDQRLVRKVAAKIGTGRLAEVRSRLSALLVEAPAA